MTRTSPVLVALLAALVSPRADALPALVAETRLDSDPRDESTLQECGTAFTPEQAAAYLRALEDRGPVDRAGSPPPYYIPIKAHIIRLSNGTGGLPTERLEQAIDDANAHYVSTGIVFYRLGDIDFIDSDDWYTTATLAEIDAMRTTNLVPDAINVYFTENLDYEGGGLCGISAFTFSDVQSIAMRNSCTANPSGLGNHSTFSHEIGHYFDLFHTHETALGDEYVDGTNCTVAGDLVCDTPADPVLGTSNVSTACIYTGTDVDAHGDPYAPDASQLMSYSLKHCRDNFSPESLVRIVDTLLSGRTNLLTNPVAAPALGENAPLLGGARIALAAAQPNPAPRATRLSFALSEAAVVDVAIYDVRGARVRSLAAGPHAAGGHVAEWDGKDAAGRAASPGIYFVQLSALGERAARKVQLVR
jgi:hypothetical protein